MDFDRITNIEMRRGWDEWFVFEEMERPMGNGSY